jgi:phosphocarrier protein
VTVVNPLGLHARAAARFVQLAARFSSQVRVARDAKVMDGKSIMGILLLAAARGTTITISANGADEQAAVEALATLVSTWIRRSHVERLTGIGVSAGVAVGPALVAIQRTQVIRFPIALDRVARELSALDRARVRRANRLNRFAAACWTCAAPTSPPSSTRSC